MVLQLTSRWLVSSWLSGAKKGEQSLGRLVTLVKLEELKVLGTIASEALDTRERLDRHIELDEREGRQEPESLVELVELIELVEHNDLGSGLLKLERLEVEQVVGWTSDLTSSPEEIKT